LHIHVYGLVWNSHSSEFCLSTWLKYDSIFVNSTGDQLLTLNILNESFVKIES